LRDFRSHSRDHRPGAVLQDRASGLTSVSYPSACGMAKATLGVLSDNSVLASTVWILPMATDEHHLADSALELQLRP
jgi:hypothetical protein